MAQLTRRQFIQASALASLAGIAGPAGAGDASGAGGAAHSSDTAANAAALAAASEPDVPLRWLEGAAPALSLGTTFTVPWPRGQQKQQQTFVLASAAGEHPMQSWPLAYWPDGSLKWTAHAMPAEPSLLVGGSLSVRPGKPASRPAAAIVVQEAQDAFTIDTGIIRCVLPRRGEQLIRSITRDGRSIAQACRLVALCDDQPDAGNGATRQQHFSSAIERTTIEQRGPLRTVAKIEGRHRSANRAWLPFTVRLYFYAGAESIRIMHTFVFDGDENKDFLRGIGLRFEVPMRDAPHDRHVRFSGEDGGLWGEGVRGLTGLRRDPGAAFRQAQVAGLPVPPLGQMNKQVSERLQLIPAWGDYTLSQLSADGFQIRKRTKPGHGWINAAWGRRAAGCGYVGGASGGVVFGLRDFWQRHPTQLDIRSAHTEKAEVTMWMWSPDAPAMDLRFYHDGMGMETHEQELEGLEINYEDYEKGFGTPVGVARSSEITLWALAATPQREQMVRMAAAAQTPPQLVVSPARYLATGVFGPMWDLPDRSSPARAELENELDKRFDFYRNEVEQRHWYGFWDYGDVMHTYDADRHTWRYDVGGYAWDNSELSPDLWLWYSFLRTGRADIFRLAEAMARHTSEVDTYHLGRFAGLGSRHNVQHWGCSAKQLRISQALYRRYYYYLTADERIGDIMRELLDADASLAAVDPLRKRAGALQGPYTARASFGTDWSSLAGTWLVEWERTGDKRWRDMLLAGMRDIAAMPQGFFSANAMGYDRSSGHLHNTQGGKVTASHLNVAFGAPEIFAELIAMLDQPRFEQAWLRYCALYNANPAEQQRELGGPHGGTNALRVGHSRLTAYAAWRRNDAELARRAWQEFFSGRTPALRCTTIKGPDVLVPVSEVPWMTTNDTAQWGLAAIQNLALAGAQLPTKS
ncbi:Tat pathway signal sequence domain protein [Pseudoduganella sp. R-31]|uniref:exo-rhamnogalacturonan lyase family protein n=1 Tax=Pseudoduganella sp. R-31 TaxID=3404060 RepID=UPI003CEFE23D